jgi:hypothetical protein
MKVSELIRKLQDLGKEKLNYDVKVRIIQNYKNGYREITSCIINAFVHSILDGYIK